MKKRRPQLILLGATLLLLVPLIAMRFTAEVDWTVSDFAVAAGLLYGTGIACELVLRRIGSTPVRIALCGGLVLLLLLTWAELAVGVFGTPFAGQ